MITKADGTCIRTTREAFSYNSIHRNSNRLAWAFWAAPVEEVVELPFAIAELNQMVDTIEEDKKIKFTEGFNPNVECIRLSLDPVVASHRPLVYYGVSCEITLALTIF